MHYSADELEVLTAYWERQIKWWERQVEKLEKQLTWNDSVEAQMDHQGAIRELEHAHEQYNHFSKLALGAKNVNRSDQS